MELAAISRKYDAAIRQNNNYKDPQSGDPRPSVSHPGHRIISALIEVHHPWSDGFDHFLCLTLVQENEPNAIPDQSPPPAPRSSVPLSGATVGMLAEEVCRLLRAKPNSTTTSSTSSKGTPMSRRRGNTKAIELRLEKESDTEHNENMVTMFPELHFYILCKQFLGTRSRSVPGGFRPLHQ